MSPLDGEIVSLLTFLLPGFIAAWVFHGLTPFPKPSQFERVVQALIFTMPIQVVVAVIAWGSARLGQVVSVGKFTEQVRIGWSVLVGLALGLLMARWATNDVIHSWLRNKNFTSLTSYPSEWFSEFSRSQTYVVLHLTGERRLYGWPEQWPSTPTEGQFSIADAEWLDGERRIPLTEVQNVLIPVSEVEMVEFMKLDQISVSPKDSHGDEEA